MEPNPFSVLSLIVAPSILTNASSVLVMSTSNRLARAVDRARELSKQLEAAKEFASAESQRRLNELSSTEGRALLLLRALRSFYVALGGFASAALVSLLGALSVPVGLMSAVQALEVLGVMAGLIAVGAIVYGSILLLRETRVAVQVITDRVAALQARAENSLESRPRGP
jgi:hypothetical protein